MTNLEELNYFIANNGSVVRSAKMIGFTPAYLYLMRNSGKVSDEVISRIKDLVEPQTKEPFIMADEELSKYIENIQGEIKSHKSTIANEMDKARRRIEAAQAAIPKLIELGRKSVIEQNKRQLAKFGNESKSPVILNESQRQDIATSDKPTTELAQIYNVSKTTIKRIRKRVTF